MDELIKAMSTSELETLKETYKENASVIAVLDGYIAGKVKEEEQAKAKKEFEGGITKLFAKLPHPDDVYNVYVRWCEVEEPIPDSEPVEVEVTKDGAKVMEMRQPTQTLAKWVVEVNKGLPVLRTTGNGRPTTSKRAITVFKRNGTQLEEKGHYASASKACEALKLTIGGDSATRVLARDGYLTEPYEGTDYNV